ncbi:uncharacterized protein SPSK_10887 [Sporothrix schenckii 1099-18]|uniref:ADP-ribosylation factor-like protein 1 n=1 Tax=Sporothrix schenckii 1099-18 TaxID=1397361 RepID=A0A0F2M7N8_SPOSC|nr:uncharacterized protein SPSK_10887 [Sporothrix schenckii 1099-18]KJR85652.1 hypothetical protein SPSK_10887 [Sporothrix schenckii 1099-18]
MYGTCSLPACGMLDIGGTKEYIAGQATVRDTEAPEEPLSHSFSQPPLAHCTPPTPHRQKRRRSLSREIEAHFFENQKHHQQKARVPTAQEPPPAFSYASSAFSVSTRPASIYIHILQAAIFTTFDDLLLHEANLRRRDIVSPPIYDFGPDGDSLTSELSPELLPPIYISQRRNSGPISLLFEEITPPDGLSSRNEETASFYRKVPETKHIKAVRATGEGRSRRGSSREHSVPFQRPRRLGQAKSRHSAHRNRKDGSKRVEQHVMADKLAVLQKGNPDLDPGTGTILLCSVAKGKHESEVDSRGLWTRQDNAGKTTLLYRLKIGEVVTTIPTIGFNVESVTYKNLNFNVWDLGGQTSIRPYWRCYYANTSAVVFVVDSTDIERLQTAADELAGMLNEEELKDAALLVFANKQDQPGAKGAADISEALQLGQLRDRNWTIIACSAVDGTGVNEGMDWLVVS